MDFKLPISFDHLKSMFLPRIFVISVWKIQVIFIPSTQVFCILNVVTNDIYFNINFKIVCMQNAIDFSIGLIYSENLNSHAHSNRFAALCFVYI